MPYDDQFFLGSQIYRRFVNSEWDNFNKSDYQCIEEFVKDNKELITSIIKEERNA
jgi:hypothetical protein